MSIVGNIARTGSKRTYIVHILEKFTYQSMPGGGDFIYFILYDKCQDGLKMVTTILTFTK